MGTGFQICREMRTLQPGLPIILISAVYRDEFAKQAAVFGGACEYLVEPVSPADLDRRGDAADSLLKSDERSGICQSRPHGPHQPAPVSSSWSSTRAL